MTDSETRMREELHWKGGCNEEWKLRTVTLKKREANGTYFLTIQGVSYLSKMLGSSRSGKRMAVELGPSIAVLHMDEFEGRKNVLGLMQVDKHGSQMLFSCECSAIFTQLKTKVQKCCSGDSFQVIIGADQIFPQGPAVLHVFQEQFHLLANTRDALVAPLGQWKIVSQQQIMQVEHGIMVNIGESSESHWLLLNTEEGGEIIGLFSKHVNYQYLPIKPEHSDGCDINRNMPSKEIWVPRLLERPSSVVDEDCSSSTTDESRRSSCNSASSSLVSQEETQSSDGTMSLDLCPDQKLSNNAEEENTVNIPDEEPNLNERTERTKIEEYNRHPPTCYVYINQISEIRREHTQGTSIKHCYENLKYLNQDPPPLFPRRKAPKVPPRGLKPSNTCHRALQLCPKVPTRPPVPHRLSLPYCQVLVAVFASACIPGEYWFLRVAVMCKDSDDDTMRRVKDHEAQSNHHFLKSQPLFVESDIKIALDVSSPGFQFEDSEDFQCVEFGDVKNLRRGDWFVIEFHLRNYGTEPKFFGKVYVGPSSGQSDSDQCRANRRLNIGISETFVTDTTNGQPGTTQAKPISTRTRPCLDVLLSNYEKRRRICRALDVTLHTDNNWKLVAGRLGLSVHEIYELEDKAHRCHDYSPMETVLNMWGQREPSSCTWKALKKILEDINRQDIIEDTEEQN